MDYFGKFKERLVDLDSNSARSRFRACSNISSDLIRASEFVEFQEGVFVGEFFETLFSNLGSTIGEFKAEDNAEAWIERAYVHGKRKM